MAKALRLAGLRAISNHAMDGKELPKRIKVLDWGLNKTLKGDVIVDSKTLKVFSDNQAKMGRERAPIDFDHNTVKGTEAHEELQGRPPTIFGYGTPKLIPGDGIWFEDIVWTPHGQEHAMDFHDLSPTPLLDEDNRVLAIHSCALTPAGAVEGLTFYSAFGSVAEIAKAMNVPESVPDAYRETWVENEKRGTHKTGAGNNEHFEYFKKSLRLSPDCTDADVKKHVMQALSAARLLDAEADADVSLKHLAAVFGFVNQNPEPSNMNQTPSVDGPALTTMLAEAVKPFEEKFTALSAEIESLKKQNADGDKAAEKAHKAAIIAKASAEGKVIPMSAETIEITPVAALEDIVSKLEKSVVPVTRKGLQPLTADGKPPKASRAAGVALINSHAESVLNQNRI